MMTRETSEKIALLSVLFAVCVVVVHVSWSPTSLGERLLFVLFKQSLGRMAVPFFFVLSGYFLSRHWTERGWWQNALRKRVRSLAVPYVIWTLVLALVLLIETGSVLGLGAFGFDLRRMPALVPLWYVRCLLLFVVILPVIRPALERRRFGVLTLCGLAYLTLSVCAPFLQLTDDGGWGGFFSYGFSLEGLFYFLSGCSLSCFGGEGLARRVRGPCLVVGVVLLIVRLAIAACGVCAWANTHVFLVPFLLVGVWGYCPHWRLPGIMSHCAFPIYILHGVVLAGIRSYTGVYAPVNSWVELIAGVAIPFLLANALRRACPRLATIVFGGR